MAEESKYTPEAMKIQLETTQIRALATGVIVIVVALLSALTYSCADSRAKDAQVNMATAQKQTDCVKAGGSWMPVQALNSGNGEYPTYEMSCVSHEALQPVIAQNANIIQRAKLN